MSSILFLLFLKIFASTPAQSIAILTPEGASKAEMQVLSDKLLVAGKLELQGSVIAADSLSNLYMLLGCESPNDACLAKVASLLKFSWLVYARSTDKTLTMWLFDANQGKTVASKEAAIGTEEALRAQLRELVSQSAPQLLKNSTSASKQPELAKQPEVVKQPEPAKQPEPTKQPEVVKHPEPTTQVVTAASLPFRASQPASRATAAATSPVWKKLLLPGALLGGSIALGLSTRSVETALLNDAQNLAQPGRSAQLRQTGFLLALGADLLWLGAAYSGWRALKKK